MPNKYRIAIRPPNHFSIHDFLNAVFGSFFVAITFLASGNMTAYALRLEILNMVAIVIFTFIVITFEIYILGYRFVRKKAKRPFYEFWGHRFPTMVLSSFVSIYALMYLYGLNEYYSSLDMLKIAIAIFLPAAAAGAAMESLRKKRY